MGRDTRTLEGKVVVITGASSGVGRATALEFATYACRVVLAARRDEELHEVAQLCAERGGEPLVVVTEIACEDEVQHLAEAACTKWGKIDVWINNAGVTLFGVLSDASFEEHRRVIETNLYGAMLSARAVVPIFKARQRGVLINVGSVLSKVGQPFVPSYAISKVALRGLSESLRAELADEPDIHVCSIFPYAIDTPLEGNLYRPLAEQGSVHGERRPQLSTPAFMLWTAGELLRMQREELRSRLLRRPTGRAEVVAQIAEEAHR